MTDIRAAYRLHKLFEQKITSEYYASFKGKYGRVQVEALNYLYANHEVRVCDLGEILDISKQHASKMIQKFEDDGLVLKKADPADGRSVVCLLSDKGRAYIEEYLANSDKRFIAKLESLSENDRIKLIESMETISELLEKL